MPTKSPRRTDRADRQESVRRNADSEWQWQEGNNNRNEREMGYSRGRSNVQQQRTRHAGEDARWERDFDRNEGNGQAQYADEGRGSRYGNQGHMSRQEAGHLGGKTVAEKYGPEFYREIGRKGGLARWGEGEGNNEGSWEQRDQQRERSRYDYGRGRQAEAQASWNRSDMNDDQYEDEDEGDRFAQRRTPYGRLAADQESQSSYGWNKDYDEEMEDDDEDSSKELRYGRDRSREEAGHKGGETTAKRYGPEFYREIGRKGGMTRQRNRSY